MHEQNIALGANATHLPGEFSGDVFLGQIAPAHNTSCVKRMVFVLMNVVCAVTSTV